MKRIIFVVAALAAIQLGFASNGYAQRIMDDAKIYVFQPWGVKFEFEGSIWTLSTGGEEQLINSHDVYVNFAKKVADFVWRETGNRCFEIGFTTAGVNHISMICGSYPNQISYKIKKSNGIWRAKRG